MGYTNLQECLKDLEARGELVRIDRQMDPDIEIGAVQRRVFRAGGPALLFTNVKGTRFPMAANIFGTRERLRYIFRDTLPTIEKLFRLKVDPFAAFKKPWQYLGAPRALWAAMPRTVSDGPVMAHQTTISELPHLRSWPMDGGAYVTLPQVYTESPARPGYGRSNLGMYRVQLTGNAFEPDREVGLHYQIHRGIGPHHAEALERHEPLKVNIFVGGPPAMTLAAIMPLPEGMPELMFAGALGGQRMRMVRQGRMLPILAEADFCISGTVYAGQQKPEGPFGDHLGYYSLAHDFPVLHVDRVTHRDGAVWPFTTVGRPPQEDTLFGDFIHELTAELVPTVFSGVHEVHAVDAAGVHPLLLAVGSERYVPYAEKRTPQELITCGLSLLGSTQTSLSKYVIIAAREDSPTPNAHDVPGFFRHMLERADFERDLHFVTRTTMDTLDYSGISLNQGSKVLWASTGPVRRRLATELTGNLPLPEGFGDPRVFAPGMLVIAGPRHDRGRDEHDPRMQALADALEHAEGLDGFPLIAVVDDSAFTAADWDNYLWVVFTRSDPATDMYGVRSFTHCKHWGTRGPLVIDARLKTYHAPALEPDPEVERRVDALGAPGGPLHGII
ncbi:4-hydroxy-3-polyprenylbenzoate decarboxylase [Desulfobaculum xiamenense]|uniref:4-hydroxy-3-polyprenylbenzoate decarboxylase n=1 Tax=Desulfobaculum xiamenense TaxID=995050 RepID=A0A846QN38_9BACT|nr:UbiD family decarboxylase [Desulfobaculum xiamenense]NJB69511.1 4-hydroxy-3-polyprenylbenzoate decarboxylase [Desulfobaculum xiamenense]